ncbi:hypothetical protein POM88_053609 [Heracleum sosnowskyi]|uniref:Uncharacterized protein n=1 Tax=Heracleum sosnowskyi TaxID=360622 RepID=A0AAD8GPZ7_9APIA|nr:hypothetical protein POM88_053609 [Heracleum sosnowskyi]
MNFASSNLTPLLPSKLFKFKTLIVAVLEEEVEEDHFVVEDKEEEMCQVKIQAHSKEEEEELVEVTMEEGEIGFFSGRKRESIFKSPDDPFGKVGVIGSGKGLTDFQKREKHLHLKGANADGTDE